MRYLIVAAHPDDEALGAGAMMHRLSSEGHDVCVCLLSHWSPTRDDNLNEGIKKSHSILGVAKTYVGDFGCMRFKDADHHAMVRFIEDAIMDCQPDVIITHHPADIHVDHGITSQCCLEAAKLPQRQIADIPAIKKIMFMEVPSSTDWNINTANGVFTPNVYVEVKQKDIAAKVDSINVYKAVLRERPHPRSVACIDALATVRGSQSGVKYAEAFQQVFELEEITDGHRRNQEA